MKRLTVKEEEIMRMFWEHGPMFVRELLVFYEEPKPHYNTVSTLVRGWVIRPTVIPTSIIRWCRRRTTSVRH